MFSTPPATKTYLWIAWIAFSFASTFDDGVIVEAIDVGEVCPIAIAEDGAVVGSPQDAGGLGTIYGPAAGSDLTLLLPETQGNKPAALPLARTTGELSWVELTYLGVMMPWFLFLLLDLLTYWNNRYLSLKSLPANFMNSNMNYFYEVKHELTFKIFLSVFVKCRWLDHVLTDCGSCGRWKPLLRLIVTWMADVWIDGCFVDGWMNEWMDGWIVYGVWMLRVTIQPYNP